MANPAGCVETHPAFSCHNKRMSESNPSQPSLKQVLELVRAAIKLLNQANAIHTAWITLEFADSDCVRARELDDLLQSMTHETASVLGFSLEHVRRLQHEIQVRNQFAMFSDSEFSSIVQEGWSLSLVMKLRADRAEITLEALSGLVKRLLTDWITPPN